jgi:hypothetical protein
VTSGFDVKSASATWRAHDLLAIIAAELALLLKAVDQELPRTGWLVALMHMG